MDGPRDNCTPALSAAQRRLEQLRESYRSSSRPAARADFPDGRPPNCEAPGEGLSQLPDHLGWDRAGLSSLICRAQSQPQKTTSSGIGQWRERPAYPDPAQSSNGLAPDPAKTIKLYPDIALAILKHEQSAAARVWLLLKSLDTDGRGWFTVEEARSALTVKEAPLRLCGWRQLRKLLARGQGVFWQSSEERIWLRTAAKIAANLGVRRLSGQPVSLPVAACRQGIGAFRAHLYASFHSGRQGAADTPERPISRATLQRLSNVSRQSQRNYERRIGVRRKANYAVGDRSTIEKRQNSAWQHGRAVFEFIDHNGALGRPAARYISWQLPNSYQGPHRTCPKGQQKQINRELAVLFTKGMTGNGELSHRRFYDNGAQAASRYQACKQQAIYWTSRIGRGQHYRLWHCLPIQEV